MPFDLTKVHEGAHVQLRPMKTVVTSLLAFTALVAPGAMLRGQVCDTVRSRVGLSAIQGMTIRSVDIQTLPPSLTLPGPAERLTRVHTATFPSTVRRELLFAPGQSLDSVSVAESLRRLRALGYLEDAQLEARTCTDSVGVALTVLTRDAWSTEPIVLLRPRSVALGISDANAFGTGRAVRLTLQSDALGFGFGASVRDPALWNGRLDGQISSAMYGAGSSWSFALRPRRRSLADPWTGEVRWASSHRELAPTPGDAFDETRVTLLGGPRLTSTSRSSTVYGLVGAEADQADVEWSPLEPLIGPAAVHRRFLGAALGIARRAARYDTLGWVLHRDGIVDVPTVTEGEIVAAFGRDLADGRAKTHVDGWLARTWTTQNRSLVTGGVWTSGYVASNLLQAATTRGSLIALTPTPNGAWEIRLAAERLYDPDPTVRALRSIDPIGALLPRAAQLAKAAASISAERDIRLWDVMGASELDAGFFGAFARRWDPAGLADADMAASMIGMGLRLAPSRTPGATFRLDVAYPVGYRTGVRARPLLALSLTPWLTAGHQRDSVQPQ